MTTTVSPLVRRRLDYLLYRGLELLDSGTLALREPGRSASDHHLVWADLQPQHAPNRAAW